MDRTCSIFECDRSPYARTWCASHYKRYLKYGSPVKGQRCLRGAISMAEYLWQNIDRHAPGGCWQWRGSLNSAGYARTSMRGTIGLAHRAMYELIVEPIPDGLVIDHLCRNRGCVNPSHLEVVTMAENTRRGERHGPIGAAPTINQKTGNIGVG